MAINNLDMRPSWQLLMAEGYRAFRVTKGKLVALPDPGDVENIFFLPEHVAVPRDCSI
jgi:hypothetical protein